MLFISLVASEEMVVVSKKAGSEGEPDREPELQINGLFANFKVEAKTGEELDKNFPPTLHAAAQLFVMTGLADAAKLLVKVKCFFQIV